MIMIPLVPVILVVGAFVFTLILFTGQAILEMQDLRSVASTNTQERLQERLRGEYEGSPTNIQQATILSEWTDESRIIGVMVKCVNGTVYTFDVDIDVPGGSLYSIPRHTMDQMQTLAGNC